MHSRALASCFKETVHNKLRLCAQLQSYKATWITTMKICSCKLQTACRILG